LFVGDDEDSVESVIEVDRAEIASSEAGTRFSDVTEQTTKNRNKMERPEIPDVGRQNDPVFGDMITSSNKHGRSLSYTCEYDLIEQKNMQFYFT